MAVTVMMGAVSAFLMSDQPAWRTLEQVGGRPRPRLAIACECELCQLQLAMHSIPSKFVGQDKALGDRPERIQVLTVVLHGCCVPQKLQPFSVCYMAQNWTSRAVVTSQTPHSGFRTF